MTLAGWANRTENVRLGLMVGANTFRNPGLVVKMVTALDHMSNGRAILGIGGAWFGREHDGYGIDFMSGFGERLDKLDEAVMLLRRLLDGERIAAHEGRFYSMRDALVAPRPIQAKLPILIGGSGPQKTLRTTAKYGDAWNTSGSLDVVRERLRILRGHCDAVGRDPAAIELTVSFPMVLRDDPAAAGARLQEQLAHNGNADLEGALVILGSPRLAADTIRPYRELGFETMIARLPAPFDRETVDRIGEVRELLDAG
jgi:alkanesulfonate monooxygenase SsuD/methylene tetrahydromethanopterin reductase-like flavin-dependent oxidoreductase (luciferase family)